MIAWLLCLENTTMRKDSNSDVKEDTKSSKEFLADQNLEFYDRALLANQKRFSKRLWRVGATRKPMDKSKETRFAFELTLLTQMIEAVSKQKNEKGLVVESFNSDEESLSFKDEGTTTVKAFMAIAKDEPVMGNNDVRLDQWVKNTMKNVQRLFTMNDGDEKKHVLDYMLRIFF
ncbi:hypothetical protein Tco_0812660 [Tanacetum coccineum]